MFYLTEVEDHVRVEPKLFGIPTIEAVEQVVEARLKLFNGIK